VWAVRNWDSAKRQVLQRERGVELPGPMDRLVAAPCSGSTGFLVTVRQQPSQNVGAVRPSKQTGCRGGVLGGTVAMRGCTRVVGAASTIGGSCMRIAPRNNSFMTGNTNATGARTRNTTRPRRRAVAAAGNCVGAATNASATRTICRHHASRLGAYSPRTRPGRPSAIL
jgi:hypothetical protein